MKATKNYVIVEVSAETDDVITTDKKDVNGNPIVFHVFTDKEHGNTFKDRRIYGKVLSVPNSIKPVVLRQKYMGSPKPGTYKGHEYLMSLEKAASKNKPIPKEQEDYFKSMYYCTDVDYEFDYEREVRVQQGDTVYFHFLTICDENWMGYNNGRKVYKVPYSSLYCAIRGDQTIMLNGNILVDPYYDENYDEIDVGHFKTRAKISKSGIVTSVKDEPEYRKGWYNGERVIYRPSTTEKENKENKRKIGDKEYYIMKEWDIVATFNPIIPKDPYVLIIPDKISKRGLIHFNKDLLLNTGKIEKGYLAGEKVFYYQKSKENIHLKEEDRILVHKEDLWAVIE